MVAMPDHIAAIVVAGKFKFDNFTPSQKERFLEELDKLGMTIKMTDDDYATCVDAKLKYKGKNLSEQAIEVYETIPGWNWDEETDEEFLVMAKKVQAFVERNGRLPRFDE